MAIGGASSTEQNRRSQYLRDVQKKRMDLLAAAQLRFANPLQKGQSASPARFEGSSSLSGQQRFGYQKTQQSKALESQADQLAKQAEESKRQAGKSEQNSRNLQNTLEWSDMSEEEAKGRGRRGHELWQEAKQQREKEMSEKNVDEETWKQQKEKEKQAADETSQQQREKSQQFYTEQKKVRDEASHFEKTPVDALGRSIASSPSLPTFPSSAPQTMEEKSTTIPYEDPLANQETEETSEDERRAAFGSTMAQAYLADENEQEETQGEESGKQTLLQKEIKKKAEAGMKRGVVYITDLIVSAFDIGSVGVSFLIDWIPWAFSLGYLNMELFYGKYLMKGKDPFISEPSWDPFPLPLPNTWVDMLIIAADILVFLIAFTAIIALVVVIAGIMSVMENPIASFLDFLGMGINIFQ